MKSLELSVHITDLYKTSITEKEEYVANNIYDAMDGAIIPSGHLQLVINSIVGLLETGIVEKVSILPLPEAAGYVIAFQFRKSGAPMSVKAVRLNVNYRTSMLNDILDSLAAANLLRTIGTASADTLRQRTEGL